MNAITKTEPKPASATDTVRFGVSVSDIAALRRKSSSSSPLNDQAVLEDCGGDVATKLLLLEAFRSNGPQKVTEISRRVRDRDSRGIAAAARDLKSSANAVSAKTLRDLAAAVEKSCGSVGRECQTSLVTKLRQEMDRCLEHISLVIATAHADAFAN